VLPFWSVVSLPGSTQCGLSAAGSAGEPPPGASAPGPGSPSRSAASVQSWRKSGFWALCSGSCWGSRVPGCGNTIPGSGNTLPGSCLGFPLRIPATPYLVLASASRSWSFPTMARLARVVAPGIPHHINRRGNCRQQTLFCEEDDPCDLELVAQFCRPEQVEIWACCLMPSRPPDPGASIRRRFAPGHRRGASQVHESGQDN